MLECTLPACRGPPQILPSIFADSLQAINAKFCNIIEVESITAGIIFTPKVTCLDLPVNGSDAANKDYVDSQIGSLAAPPFNSVQFNNGGSFGGSPSFTWINVTSTLNVVGTVTGLILPTLGSDATNKTYVDNLVAGLVAPPLNSVQFNNAGAFDGSANLTWVDATSTLSVIGTLTDGVASLNAGDLLGLNDLDANGIVSFTGATASTSPITGTLVVSGGVGIGGDVHIGGKVFGDKFLTTSDELLKEDISPLTNSLSKLREIECYEYRYRDRENCDKRDKRDKLKSDETKLYGVIAQQLEKIGLNNLVDNSRQYKSVNYINIIAMLIDSVKELDREIALNKFDTNEIGTNRTNVNKFNEIFGILMADKIQEVYSLIDKSASIEDSKISTLKKNLDSLTVEYDDFVDNFNETKSTHDAIKEEYNTLENNVSKIRDSVADKLKDLMSDVIKEEVKKLTSEYEETIIKNYEITQKKKRRRIREV